MVLVATAGAAASFTLWLFWPGYMSWDSADQWRQALSGEFTDIAPPLMGMIWRAIGTLVPGPGGMLLLQTVLWWSCIALAVGMTQQGRLLRAVLLLLLLGFWPALWGVLPHVWKDVWMALAFAGYIAALAVLLPAFGNHGLWAALMVFFGLRAVTLALRYPALERAAG